jgi:tetratricopeptide (TPR) repeat protein
MLAVRCTHVVAADDFLCRRDRVVEARCRLSLPQRGWNARRNQLESDECDGISMDSLITAAARALAAGDPLAALNRVALRSDAPALALRGIAMAQLGDFTRAKELLRSAARAFAADEATARARCVVAEAEIALVSRDLGGRMQSLGAARATLEARGDRANAAHAGYLQARRLLLIGRLDESERTLDALDVDVLPQASRTGYWLVAAGIAMRRIRAKSARAAIDRARHAARATGISALAAEVDRASVALDASAARLIARDGQRLLGLADVEALITSGALVVDACRSVVRAGTTVVPLAGRPVLFALARALAEASPGDVSREALIARAFRARDADESHRARLRVEIGRLRKTLKPLAILNATKRGFMLRPHRAQTVAVLAPPVEGDHAEVLALLADGEAWSSSALALALDVSPRTVQRALEALAEDDTVKSFGRGRACRWMVPNLPGFPTSLLLPAPLTSG